MTVEAGGPDQSWVAWALGGLLTIGATALKITFGQITKTGREVENVKRDYMRRDDMAIHLAPINATLSAIANDMGLLRERTHEIANAVAKLEGRQERREAQGRS